ncbi:MAG: DUF2505 family protein [Deltaproteobacteria bacterium]|nr:DUF2505 family protein [Deltaproteobacteria bacterium]
MQFEIVHDFDIPLDALELAVISPDLVVDLARKLTNIESVQQKEHLLEGGRLERMWSYRANVKIPAFATRYVTPEMLAWDEKYTYDLERHASDWLILPHGKPEWRNVFAAQGTYALAEIGSGRTRRRVVGNVELRVSLVRTVAEKLIFGEMKKVYDAEADTLRALATLS